MTPAIPSNLALIDDDRDYAGFLAQFLRSAGIEVTLFADSDDLLVHPQAFAFQFYILDLMLPGIDGLSTLRLLRKRTSSGIVVASGRLGADTFRSTIEAGADMYIAKPVQFEQVLLVIRAVFRRTGPRLPMEAVWMVDETARQLVTPDGKRVELSELDLAVLSAFIAADGAPVTRDELLHRLGRSGASDVQSINGIIFRLRRRIEQATPLDVPIETKARVGYAFRGTVRRL